MNYSQEIKRALEHAWHLNAAKNSLQRWLDLADREGWYQTDDALSRITSLFGASWYFTRFCFFRGENILRFFEADKQNIDYVKSLLVDLENLSADLSPDTTVELLRIKKNEIMLLILLLQLGNVIDQEQTEYLLTRLAQTVLLKMYKLFKLDEPGNVQCVVLAMGRFAGYEMNYGSDLDLIFIEKIIGPQNDIHLTNRIRKMLRYISVIDPSGALYEIDMRLRPHGSSGILVTPHHSFSEFHKGEREIWERQMMTRCRAVAGASALSKQIEQEIIHNIYGKYDLSFLAREIIKVRLLVEQELAGGSDKFELKRGMGGIMDLDFLTHFLQLAYGREHSQLRATGTRQILRTSATLGLIDENVASLLCDAYDFYKKSESVLRVFDMKSISSMNKETRSMLPVARASGFKQQDYETAVSCYQQKLIQYRNEVRAVFESVINAVI